MRSVNLNPAGAWCRSEFGQLRSRRLKYSAVESSGSTPNSSQRFTMNSMRGHFPTPVGIPFAIVCSAAVSPMVDLYAARRPPARHHGPQPGPNHHGRHSTLKSRRINDIDTAHLIAVHIVCGRICANVQKAGTSMPNSVNIRLMKEDFPAL